MQNSQSQEMPHFTKSPIWNDFYNILSSNINSMEIIDVIYKLLVESSKSFHTNELWDQFVFGIESNETKEYVPGSIKYIVHLGGNINYMPVNIKRYKNKVPVWARPIWFMDKPMIDFVLTNCDCDISIIRENERYIDYYPKEKNLIDFVKCCLEKRNLIKVIENLKKQNYSKEFDELRKQFEENKKDYAKKIEELENQLSKKNDYKKKYEDLTVLLQNTVL